MDKQTAKSEDGEVIEVEVGVSPQLHRQDLPKSEFEGESYGFEPKEVAICSSHKENPFEGQYLDNHDGTVSCRFCPWGAILSGGQRVVNGKVMDLKSL